MASSFFTGFFGFDDHRLFIGGICDVLCRFLYSGTLTAIAEPAGLKEKDGKIKNLDSRAG